MKFYVTGKVTITVTTEMEALDETTARLLAEERAMSGSWRDNGNREEEWVHDELDGEPTIISVTPATGDAHASKSKAQPKR
jgi:muconolactone delta-isomerase